MSWRDETIDIISIAQQARPNVSGHIELDCAQATAFSTVVSRSASSICSTSCSKTPGPAVGPEQALGLEPGLGERAVADAAAAAR